MWHDREASSKHTHRAKPIMQPWWRHTHDLRRNQNILWLKISIRRKCCAWNSIIGRCRWERNVCSYGFIFGLYTWLMHVIGFSTEGASKRVACIIRRFHGAGVTDSCRNIGWWCIVEAAAAEAPIDSWLMKQTVCFNFMVHFLQCTHNRKNECFIDLNARAHT